MSNLRNSPVEENYGNNIISLENLEEMNENYLLRAPKKGKLIKGPNWTAFKRENLGIIPSRTENILIEDKNSKTSLGFNSQSERFSGRVETVKYAYPGPGAYSNSVLDSEKTRPSTSFSSKGYGNGFISESERFDNPKLYYSKYFPGPGQYKLDDKISIKSEIGKKIQYKSLYEKASIKSLKVKQDFPGPGFYNPSLLSQISSKGSLSAFRSAVTRFKRETTKCAFPGPGKYFKDNNQNKIENNSEDIKKGNTLSYFFKQPSPKKDDPIHKYIETDKKDEANFKLRQNYNEGQVFINQVYFSDSPENNKFNSTAGSTKFGKFALKIDSEKINQPQTRKDLLYTIRSKYRRSNKKSLTGGIQNRNLSAQPMINIKKSNFENEQKFNDMKESQLLKEVLGKTQKKPLFELSPLRWTKQNMKHLPGPAYYNPTLPPKKVDFYNMEESRWI